VEAALAQVLADLELPKPEDFTGKRSERVVALVRAMYAFYAKGADWYPWLERDRDAVPALARMEKHFERQFGALVGAVVGPLARDKKTMAAISLVLSPARSVAPARRAHAGARGRSGVRAAPSLVGSEVAMRTMYNLMYRYSTPPWVLGPRAELKDAVTSGRLHPGRAIDLGCGEGDNAIYLAEHGFTMTGVDYAEAAIDKARAKAARAG
jgi:hypothetical protein